MLVQILVDNKNSWILPYAAELCEKIISTGNNAKLLHDHKDVIAGDVLCLLSCENIFQNLKINKHNLVVHESDLPKGKGWSPISWKILEGENKIPVTLFEAAEEIDAGPIYEQKLIELDGTELIDEIRHKQGKITQELILNFLKSYPNNPYLEQKGKSSYYPRRRPKDSQLCMEKSLKEQFNLLRISDNERYPAFFYFEKQKYILKIFKENEEKK